MTDRHGTVSPQFDLAILGGGIAALWLAWMATQRGLRSCLLAEKDIGGYASAGNQGWLHTGALYAAYGSPALVSVCQEGTKDIERLLTGTGSSLSVDGGSALFGARDDTQRDQLLRRMKQAGIPAAPLTVLQALRLSPLAGPTCRYVTCPDTPIDTAAVISTLAGNARSRGLAVIDMGNLERTECWQASEGWSIRVATGQQLRARFVVIALGAATRQFAARIENIVVPDWRSTTSRVLVIHRPVPPVIVVSLRRSGPHAVPAIAEGTAARFTVCLPFDSQVQNVSQPPPPAAAAAADMLGKCQELRQPLKALARQATGGMPISLYWCEKVQGTEEKPGTPATREPRSDCLAPGCFTLYAGKFTTASVAARLCLSKMVKAGLAPIPLPGLVLPESLPQLPGDRIAVRPALATANLLLHLRSGRLLVTEKPVTTER